MCTESTTSGVGLLFSTSRSRATSSSTAHLSSPLALCGKYPRKNDLGRVWTIPESQKISTGIISVATSIITLIVPYPSSLRRNPTKKYVDVVEAKLNAKIAARSCSSTCHSEREGRGTTLPRSLGAEMCTCSWLPDGTTRKIRILRVLLGLVRRTDWLKVLPRGMWLFMKGRTL